MGSSQSQNASNSENVRHCDVESWSAGDKLIQDYFKEVRFDSVAVWARALTNKAGIETGYQGLVAKSKTSFKDVCLRIFSLWVSLRSADQLQEIPTTGHLWRRLRAWITRSLLADRSHPLYTLFQGSMVYFVAQFGEGDVIPTINWRNPTETKRAAQTFSGRIVRSSLDAVKLMNVQDNSLDTWVVRPPTSGWQYPFLDGVVKDGGLDWKKTSPKSIKEMNALLFQTSATEKAYSWDKNNCQHFAEEIYNLCKY